MRRAALTGLLAVCSLLAQAQEEKPKTGWVFTPMPNISYNSDVGLLLGAYSDFFYYGDGTVYPNFLHHTSISAAFATKGSWYVHGMFESVALIPGLRISASATYRDARVNNFYGFNGVASPFHPELELNKDTRTAWYTNSRRLLRVAGAVQGKITGHLHWMGGLVFRHVMMDDFSLKNYDSGKSLFLYYRQTDLIHEDEFKGGTSLELKGGVTFDTRDVELFPSKGMYGELMLVGNGDLKQWRYSYLQLAAQWKHFVSIIPKWLIFAYHLGFQHTLAGEIPYYNLNELATISYLYEENCGFGSRYSIRGLRLNRVAAAGYAWANFEMRVIPFKFNLFKQYFEIVFNPFLDLLSITKTYREEEMMYKLIPTPGVMPASIPGLWYTGEKRPVMATAGMGVKLQMNTNFILSLDIGKGFDPQLSDLFIGMATTYVF